MSTPRDFDGKVVVITGGSRGLGRAMALGFAEQGASVVIASRKIEACKALAQEIADRGLPAALPIACHAGSWDDCDALVETTVETLGKIDVLVNNAGMSPHYPSLTELSAELVDKVMSVNLTGPLRLSIKAAEAMTRTGGGSIINISSVAAVQPASYDLPYAIAKSGVNTMTIGLAKALGPSVRVNAIMPGPFETDVVRAWNQETFDRIESQTALGRVGAPDEIVGAALYLAGSGSSYTTGAILKIDGGMAWSPA